MTARACTRRVSAPACYLGRLAALWLAALAPTSTTRTLYLSATNLARRVAAPPQDPRLSSI